MHKAGTSDNVIEGYISSHETDRKTGLSSLSYLDTLVQLVYKESLDPVKTDKTSSENSAKALKKKAIRIHKTFNIIYPLIDLHSPLEKQYWQTYNCCRELIQEGSYLRAKYCNKRWCLECNAIRAAKMINGYMPVFKEFKNPQYVTLTRPNIPADKLADEINYIVSTFTLIKRYLRRYKKVDLKGIRKLEVTYNWTERTYHPHLHLLVDSPGTAHAILDEWLFRNPEASPAAQDIRPADAGTYTELFKYATKICVDNEMSLYAKDFIFQVLQGKRIYQPFGITKFVSENIEEIVTQAYGSLDPFEVYKKWYFNNETEDWNSLYGESLINTILTFNTS